MDDQKGGYECDFIDKPPKSVQSECPVCLLVLKEPYQVTCCGYAYCRACIETIEKNNKPCPCCNLNNFDKFEDKRLKRSLYEFKVYCSNRKEGCQWVGELRQLDNHLNPNPTKEKQLDGCKFTQVKCLHCYSEFLRSTVQLHQSDQCPKRPFSCKYCKNFDSCYEEVTNDHWPVCGSYPVSCTNQCGETFQRQNLKSHINNGCPLTIINCVFQHVGCEVRLPCKDMSQHLAENISYHMSLHVANYKQVVDKVKRLEKDNKQLKKQVAKLTRDVEMQQTYTPIYVCPVELTMTNFDQKKNNQEKWYSPPFYTQPKGYKLCFMVYSNGWRDGEGTHVSAFISVMKGDFDDQLDWPFRGDIHITLLNQANDEGHYDMIIKFSTAGGGDTASRVTQGEISKKSRGCHKLISHSDLCPKYLKNDCLKFRISTK